MGWWKINYVERGGVDFAHVCPTNPVLANAVPGVSSKDLRYNGDGPADVMSEEIGRAHV